MVQLIHGTENSEGNESIHAAPNAVIEGVSARTYISFPTEGGSGDAYNSGKDEAE